MGWTLREYDEQPAHETSALIHALGKRAEGREQKRIGDQAKHELGIF